MKNEAYQLYANIKASRVGIGDLVRINPKLAIQEDCVPDVYGVLGIVIGKQGVRCKVQWATGEQTLPERSVLEVVV
tara:strand:+ start:306 stop:533 length:228 start_codon:yes stop_codon:yes gene_type:complete